MSRYERNTAVLFKMEASYGVDPVPLPATDALLLRKFTFKQELKYVNNPEVRPYMGKGLDYVASKFISGSFEVAIAGSGTAGTPPMWGRFPRAAAFAEVITAGVRVDYTPISTALESGTMYYYDDGTMKKILGLRCNITSIKYPFGDLPVFTVNYIGLDGGDTAVAPPGLTLSAWKQPLAVNTANSGLLTLGCTYAAGALVGGTTYGSKGLEVSLGGAINYMGLLGGESVEFTDRDVNGKITLDLTAAQEISNFITVLAGTTTGLGLTHGTVAGNKSGIFLPNVQLKNPVKDVLNGKRVITYDINSIPTPGTGNDEVRIFTL
jgi:hypothetical protein